VIGEPVDNKPLSDKVEREPIHKPAPDFVDQSTKAEILETGIKVIDLICRLLRVVKWECLAVLVLVKLW